VFLPSDFGFRDNPLSFEASRFSEGVVLSGKDAGTRSTSSQMIQQFSAHLVHQSRCIQIGRPYSDMKIFSIWLVFGGHARISQLGGGKQFLFRVQHTRKDMANKVNTGFSLHLRPENKRVYGINRRYGITN